eukprot:m.289988 g.289988  ORF g.289988 m.289988 type:complete len:101 (+) comp17802_c1_seq4:6925-7227(+)
MRVMMTTADQLGSMHRQCTVHHLQLEAEELEDQAHMNKHGQGVMPTVNSNGKLEAVSQTLLTTPTPSKTILPFQAWRLTPLSRCKARMTDAYAKMPMTKL